MYSETSESEQDMNNETQAEHIILTINRNGREISLELVERPDAPIRYLTSLLVNGQVQEVDYYGGGEIEASSETRELFFESPSALHDMQEYLALSLDVSEREAKEMLEEFKQQMEEQVVEEQKSTEEREKASEKASKEPEKPEENGRIKIPAYPDFEFTVEEEEKEWITEIFYKGNPVNPALVHKNSWNLSQKSRDDEFIRKLKVLGIEKKEAERVLFEFSNSYVDWKAKEDEKSEQAKEQRDKENLEKQAIEARRIVVELTDNRRLVITFNSEKRRYEMQFENGDDKCSLGVVEQPDGAISDPVQDVIKALLECKIQGLTEDENIQLTNEIIEKLKPYYLKIIALNTILDTDVRKELVYQCRLENTKSRDKYAGITRDGKPLYFGCRVPKEYQISWEGIEEEKINPFTGESAGYEHITDIRVMVTGRLNSADGTDMVQVTWVDYQDDTHILRKEFVPLSSVLGVKEFREHLRSKNLRIDDTELKDVIPFLNACISANEGKKDTEFLTGVIYTKNGWQFTDCTKFVCGNRLFSELNNKIIEQPIYFHDDVLANKLSTGGTLEDWIKAVNPLMVYKSVWFVMCDALSSILLRILKQPPHSVIISDATTRGKTTALQMAASCIGNPDDIGSGLLNTGDISIAAANIYLKDMLDLPTFFDETTGAKDEFRKTFPYLIGNAQAPARATKEGKLRARDTYMSVAFVSAEESLISMYANDGANTRAITLKERLIPENMKTIVDNAKDGVKLNYGHILKPFLLQVFRFKKQLKKAFDSAKDRLVSLVPSSEDRIKRQAAYFACAEISAAMLSQAFTQINKTSTEKLYVRTKEQIQADINELWLANVQNAEKPMAIRALACFADLVSAGMNMHGLEFDQITEEYYNAKGNITHRKLIKQSIYIWHDGKYIHYLPTQLRNDLKREGFTNVDGILKDWRERGIIEFKPKDTENRFTVKRSHCTNVDTDEKKQIRVVSVIVDKMNEYLNIGGSDTGEHQGITQNIYEEDKYDVTSNEPVVEPEDPVEPEESYNNDW